MVHSSNHDSTIYTRALSWANVLQTGACSCNGRSETDVRCRWIHVNRYHPRVCVCVCGLALLSSVDHCPVGKLHASQTRVLQRRQPHSFRHGLPGGTAHLYPRLPVPYCTFTDTAKLIASGPIYCIICLDAPSSHLYNNNNNNNNNNNKMRPLASNIVANNWRIIPQSLRQACVALTYCGSWWNWWFATKFESNK
jgi:hypothetical protein